MRVKDLQEFLGSFTEGSEAVKNAVELIKQNYSKKNILKNLRKLLNT